MTTENTSIAIEPSRFLCVLTLSAATLACISIVVCQIFYLLKIFFLFGVLCYTLHQLKKYCFLKNQESIVCCQQLNGHLWRLKCRSGKVFIAQESVYSYRSFFLIVLYFNLRCSKKRVKVPIAFDATAKLIYIELLSRLLLKRSIEVT